MDPNKPVQPVANSSPNPVGVQGTGAPTADPVMPVAPNAPAKPVESMTPDFMGVAADTTQGSAIGGQMPAGLDQPTTQNAPTSSGVAGTDVLTPDMADTPKDTDETGGVSPA